MGTPPRVWLVAPATAMQESLLRNINYRDRESLGLFQQRPSQGRGTPAQVTDLGDGQMVKAPNTGEFVRVRPVPWEYAELVPVATRPGTTPNRA